MNDILLHVKPEFLEPRIRAAVQEILPANLTPDLVVKIRVITDRIVQRAVTDLEIHPEPFVSISSGKSTVWITVDGRPVILSRVYLSRTQ